jgi:hypothetical protein
MKTPGHLGLVRLWEANLFFQIVLCNELWYCPGCESREYSGLAITAQLAICEISTNHIP